uniref:Ephrin n=1 Tax=Ciona intestinalis TaxID=7719 RepID=Q4H3M1_CIOIN|nr:ephrin precursor [Ciona intestinalis]BAE06406.1 ephrin [Ciona intestinalis]|eukprot:NP_001071949.1 ephrin precursor [Ciona intestinalis]
MPLSKVNRMILSLFMCYLLFDGVRSKRFNSGTITHEVMWDPRENGGFAFGNEFSIEVHMRDYMNIHCPQYDQDDKAKLSFIIYNVSEQSYNSCSLTDMKTAIFKCDNPVKGRKLTTKFQRRSPNPLGFVYQPNKDYFFMAFKKDEPQNCKSAMKMKVHVLPKRLHEHDRKPVTAGTTRSSTPRTLSSTTTTTTIATTTTTTPRTSQKPHIPRQSSTRNTPPTKTLKPGYVRGDGEGDGPGGGVGRITCATTWMLVALVLTVLLQN